MSKENIHNDDTELKSILKLPKDKLGNAAKRTLNISFNEENIRKTFHPDDKDYGFDKIDEPKTPYESNEGPVDPNELADKILALKYNQGNQSENKGTNPDFEKMRKDHYRIGDALKKHNESDSEYNCDSDPESPNSKFPDNKQKEFIEKRIRMNRSEYPTARRFIKELKHGIDRDGSMKDSAKDSASKTQESKTQVNNAADAASKKTVKKMVDCKKP